jgi:hypothetical protein
MGSKHLGNDARCFLHCALAIGIKKNIPASAVNRNALTETGLNIIVYLVGMKCVEKPL